MPEIITTPLWAIGSYAILRGTAPPERIFEIGTHNALKIFCRAGGRLWTH